MTWMVYGANGYTGRMVAELAVRRGERPVLAGRAADRVVPLAERLGLEHRVFGLEGSLGEHLAGIDTVAHCAGPFSATALPMVRACLAAGAHYLDITGEISVFEDLALLSRDAERAGAVLLPGAGFDVVPTDCLAAMLAADLPGATHLELAFTGMAGASPGTLKTMVESLGQGGKARINGELRTVSPAWRTRWVDFPHGRRQVVSIPWGDVSTAYRSTGIPNIACYADLGMPPLLFRAQQLFTPVLGLPPVRAALTALASRVPGPTEQARAKASTQVWGRVVDAEGRAVTRTLTTPEAYELTADSVVRAVQRIRSGEVAPGTHTPSSAFGASFVRSLTGVEVQDVQVG
ncbi:saccharopine dehydrogenase (NAD+, L-lysine-forming) [Crossiella equi]|uniref:Saccharopine dehydrogenase (NAD+, L-lysine-forming) n=1 Tax=Crossiella equi TaxID=130796 RepID=A0ABS5ADX6_9PSEU|nr:saccharopine dehydrogenase NADP-binding domain-containing protein [Crossiella equi]MBP2473905.1 saccharopine dehydrogenase (NAD+, L-lysine-forming) [Crossiella equi]